MPGVSLVIGSGPVPVITSCVPVPLPEDLEQDLPGVLRIHLTYQAIAFRYSFCYRGHNLSLSLKSW